MTDTTPMRERLARALCSEFDALPDAATYMHRKSNPDKHWLDKGEVLADVDAILLVLEEATNGMIAATYPVQAEWEAKDGGYWRIPDCLHSRYWTAMVKAIRGGA